MLHSNDTASLADDPRFVPSGISDPRAQISAPGAFEGYVTEEEAAAVRRDHLLRTPGDGANVYLHVVRGAVVRVPRLTTIADLMEHGGPREIRQAVSLCAEVFP